MPIPPVLEPLREALRRLPVDADYECSGAVWVTVAPECPGVQLPPVALAHKTAGGWVVLAMHFQHHGLTVDDDGFRATMGFGGVPCEVVVPWAAIAGAAIENPEEPPKRPRLSVVR